MPSSRSTERLDFRSYDNGVSFCRASFTGQRLYAMRSWGSARAGCRRPLYHVLRRGVAGAGMTRPIRADRRDDAYSRCGHRNDAGP